LAIKEEDRTKVGQENTEQQTGENKELTGEQPQGEATTPEACPPEDAPEAGKPEEEAKEQVDLGVLMAELEKAKKEKEEYLQTYLRLRADFDNFRRRSREELAQAVRQGKEELLQELLPVLDNWERALGSTGELENWRKGVEMIFEQFKAILANEGVSPIPTVGEPFDPRFHEAVLREPSAEPENTILEELSKGYLFGEKTLRPSKVKVAAYDPDLASGKEKE